MKRIWFLITLMLVLISSIKVTVFTASEMQQHCCCGERYLLESERVAQAARDAMIDAERSIGFAENARNSHELIRNLYAEFPRCVSGNVIYPDFFGGWQMDEYGNPVIFVVNSAFADFNHEISTMRNIENVTLRFVEFSYAYLIDTLSKLDELFLMEDYAGYRLRDEAAGVRMWGLRPGEHNTVVVTVDCYDIEIVATIKEAVNPDAVLFELFHEAFGEILFGFGMNYKEELP